MSSARLAALSAVLAIAGAPAPAAAHSYSVAYSDVRIADDRTSARYELRLNAADLAEPLGLPADADVSDAAIAAGADRLYRYAVDHIALEGDGAVCAPAPAGVDVVRQTDRFARIAWTCTWPAPIAAFAIEYDVFFDDLDPRHTGLLAVTAAGRTATATLVADASRFEWTLAEPPPSSLFEFALSGIDHILRGPDHILFLVGLLLVAALARIRDVLAIVTSFTIAHSITLVLAALGVFTLPSRLVESVIALSIVWVAVENVALETPRHRWALAFGFGLIHGLGFATMLTPLLPDTGVVVPLLAFNLGVELGQLGIVAVALPLLVLAARRAGRDGYRRWLVVPGSVAVAAVGAYWLVQRV